MASDEETGRKAILHAVEYARIISTGIGPRGDKVTTAAAIESVKLDAEADGILIDAALATLAIRIAYMVGEDAPPTRLTVAEVLDYIENEARKQ